MARKIIHIYYRHSSMSDYACFYCGAHGESTDHIPPVSYSDYFEDKRILVRCCLLCNQLLGNRSYCTLLSRCDFLLIKYQKRFRKILGYPEWKEWELEELKGKLKRDVILGLKKKKHIENKILFLRNNIINLQGY